MHHFTRRQLLAATTALAFGLAGAAPALAQSPSAPLRVIMPFSAGSGVDTIIRAAQNGLAKALNRPVVIENLAGAGGISGTSQLVKAAPDGNTIAFVSNNHAVNPSVFKKMPYDTPERHHADHRGGRDAVRAGGEPGQAAGEEREGTAGRAEGQADFYNFASSGNGTIIHLAAEMFVDAADVKAKHIPYKGVGPMVTDIIGGQVDFGVVAVNAAQQHIQSGALRPVAAMGGARIASLPDLPTLKEQGFKDAEVGGWFAAIAPGKMPAAEVKKLQSAIAAAFAMPDVKEAMAKQQNVINPTTPEAAAQFFKTEQARYARLVQKADVKLD
jgi:tripartite-type tricarboxylate transporter receptor subunit TctC